MTENIKELVNITQEITNVSGKKDKQELLAKYQSNTLFVDAMVFLLNPFVKTGIQRKKLDKPFETSESFNDLRELMTYLENYSTGRGEDVGRVQNYMKSLETEEEREFIVQLVTETLKMGVSAKTINKVYGKDTVPVFDLQAAKNFKDIKDPSKLGYFFMSLKLDGNRCSIFKENNVITLRSRSGQIMEGYQELEEHFANLEDNHMFDGELLIHDYDKSITAGERFLLTQKLTRKNGLKTNLEVNLFDIVPIEEFKKGESKLPYTERRAKLDAIEETELLKIVPIIYQGTDIEVVSEYLGDVLAKGLEGLMLNIGDAPYRTKRSNDIIKLKGILSGDGLVKDVYSGKLGGKNENLLGGLLVTYKDTLVRIGGGFSDEQRELFWNNPEDIIGKVVEYNYTEASKNDKGEIDLRYSRFVTVRDDKTEDDLNYE